MHPIRASARPAAVAGISSRDVRSPPLKFASVGLAFRHADLKI
jgi:hypothetical protein